MSVKTLCHQPQQPLENIMLSNYSSNECVMAPQPSEDGVLFVCGCLGEHECNDKLIFDKGSNGKKYFFLPWNQAWYTWCNQTFLTLKSILLGLFKYLTIN